LFELVTTRTIYFFGYQPQKGTKKHIDFCGGFCAFLWLNSDADEPQNRYLHAARFPAYGQSLSDFVVCSSGRTGK
jgi:hypothetical protein